MRKREMGTLGISLKTFFSKTGACLLAAAYKRGKTHSNLSQCVYDENYLKR